MKDVNEEKIAEYFSEMYDLFDKAADEGEHKAFINALSMMLSATSATMYDPQLAFDTTVMISQEFLNQAVGELVKDSSIN